MANQILLTVIGTPNFTMSFSTDEVMLAQSSGTTQANSVLYIDEYNSFPILQSISDVATLAGSAMIQATIMPQNIAALFPSSSKIVGVTRGSNGINSYIQFKNQTFYLAQTQSSLVTAANSGGNGGGGFPAQLDADTTVDLNGKELEFQQGGNNFLYLDPTVDNEVAELRAYNITDNGNLASFYANTTDLSTMYDIRANFNDGAFQSEIEGEASATNASFRAVAGDGNTDVSIVGDFLTQSITYTAVHHRPNLVEYANNSAAISGGLAAGDTYKTSGTVKVVT